MLRINLMFIYTGDGNWHCFDFDRLESAALEVAAKELAALANGQEVETFDMMRRGREFR